MTRWDKPQGGKHVIPSANSTDSQIDLDTLVSLASVEVLMWLNLDNSGNFVKGHNFVGAAALQCEYEMKMICIPKNNRREEKRNHSNLGLECTTLRLPMILIFAPYTILPHTNFMLNPKSTLSVYSALLVLQCSVSTISETLMLTLSAVSI